VDVHVPGIPGYRDFTLAFSDRDPIIGGDDMPYETAVSGPALINYTAARLAGDTGAAFAGARATPLLRAYPGDPVKVHVVGAPGSEQGHVFSLGGQPWHVDPNVAGSNQISSQGFGAWETVDIEVLGGAGGVSRSAGDYFYGDLRRPFTQAGMWGLMRVQPDPTCPIKPLDGLSCMGQASMIDVTPPAVMASPKTGLYNAAQSITLAASEPGNIYYTFDGSDPARSTTRTLYTGPFSVAATTMLKFMAVDRARNWSAVSSETYTIDTVAPDVSIVVRPATLSADSSPSLDFSAAESGVTFKCSLSSGADDFAACNPPKAYGPLADGTYTFKVQATDRAGNTGAPTVYTFSVDTQAPTVVIDSKPSTPLSDPNLSFSFTSEAGVSFVCSLSTGVDDFEPCASPASVSSLPDGA
jgi:hypothetical protein